jgi:hypothetical protein
MPAVSETLPVNPFADVTVIVEEAAAFAFTVALVGLAVIMKLVMVAVWCVKVPLVPVTVTV